MKAYTANGLLPNSINCSTIFGHDPASTCTWILKAQKSGFVPVSATPFCGHDVAGTTTLSGDINERDLARQVCLGPAGAA